MSLSTPILRMLISSTLTGTAGLATASVPIVEQVDRPLTTGTGANQADKIYSVEATLAASATHDRDLAGSLTDALGAALTFVRIKVVYVKADSANTNSVQVTRPAANGVPLFMAAGDGIALRPGAAFMWMCADATGVAVTAGTGDLLTFTNSAAGTGVTYRLVIIGASA